MASERIDNVEVEIPIRPNKLTGHVIVTSEALATCRDHTAEVKVIAKVTDSVVYSNHIGSMGDKCVLSGVQKVMNDEKKTITLHFNQGKSRIRVTAKKKDYTRLEQFYRKIEPLFKPKSNMTNYQQFESKSSILPSISPKTPKPTTPLSASALDSHPPKPLLTLNTTLTAEQNTPEKPSPSRKRQASDSFESAEPEAASPPKQTLSFYGKGDENAKDYGGFRKQKNQQPAAKPSLRMSLLMDPPVPRSSINFAESETKTKDSKSGFFPSFASTPSKPVLSVASLNAADYRKPKSSPSSQQGLLNLGNTCYMNAVIQLLFAIKSFIIELKEANDKFAPASNASSGGSTPSRAPFKLVTDILANKASPSPPSSVFRALHKLASLWDKKSANETPVGGGQTGKVAALSAFKKAISAKAAQFKGFCQEDAHEFLVELLDILRDEVNDEKRVRGRSGKETDENENRPQGRPDDGKDVNPVVNNFEMTIQNKFKCEGCGAETKNEENILCLETPLSCVKGEKEIMTLSVQDVVNSYFQEEKVEKRCDECGGDQALKTIVLKRRPRILVLALLRYAVDSTTTTIRKNCRPISISSHVTVGHLSVADSLAPPALDLSREPLSSPTDSSASLLPPLAAAKRIVTALKTEPGPTLNNTWLSASRHTVGSWEDNDHGSYLPLPTESLDVASGYFSAKPSGGSVVIDDEDDEDDELKRVIELSRLEAESLSQDDEEDSDLMKALKNSLQTATPPRPPRPQTATPPRPPRPPTATPPRQMPHFPLGASTPPKVPQAKPPRPRVSPIRAPSTSMPSTNVPSMSTNVPSMSTNVPSTNVPSAKQSKHDKLAELRRSDAIFDDAFPNLLSFRQLPMERFPEKDSSTTQATPMADEKPQPRNRTLTDFFETTPKQTAKDPKEMTEEEQFQMALELSMKEDSTSPQDVTLTYMEGPEHLNDAPPPALNLGDGLPPCPNVVLPPSPPSPPDKAADTLRQNEAQGFLPQSFRLLGVISHQGFDPGCGHYVTDAYKFQSDSWHRLDDSHVSSTTLLNVKDGQSKRAYVFAYMDNDVFKKLQKHYKNCR